MSVPLQPIAVKPVTPNPGTLAGGRSSIHGRKMMSIREQQEQMNKKNISEFVLRLKAEQELEVRFYYYTGNNMINFRKHFKNLIAVKKLVNKDVVNMLPHLVQSNQYHDYHLFWIIMSDLITNIKE